MIRSWYYNVWRYKRWIFNGEYRYYYCNRWCFITNQRLCRTPSKRRKSDGLED